jgi:hypothetical protein
VRIFLALHDETELRFVSAFTHRHVAIRNASSCCCGLHASSSGNTE